MTNNEKVVVSYFSWLCDLICDSRKLKMYSRMLHHLFSIEFKYVIFMDKNRYEDGLALRYRFAQDLGFNSNEVHNILDEPCSILEMMVALALRCEENILTSTEYDSRTGFLFWNMVESLGLIEMTNEFFDIDELELIISRFLNREYDRTGAGGLFTVKGIPQDMRDVEIWMQMNWYVSQMVL